MPTEVGLEGAQLCLACMAATNRWPKEHHGPGTADYMSTVIMLLSLGMAKSWAYAGHRHRVCMLLARTAPMPPRRGPRMPIRDYRAI